MFKKALKWIGHRVREKSTYTGLALIAGVAGAQKLGMQIDQVGQAVTLVLGSGLVAATTKMPTDV